MRIISWNVNGLAACVRKGFYSFIARMKPDIICLQEVRSPFPLNMPDYPYIFWNLSKSKKGYAGTLLASKIAPVSCRNGIGVKKYDSEGRVITAEFEDYYIIDVYVPNINTHTKSERIDYRLAWDAAFRGYIKKLKKPVIICGDLNVAHRFIDVYPANQQNQKTHLTIGGFSTEERESFEALLDIGLVDAYRNLNPFTTGAYTWWGPKNMNRGLNRGSRLDYFLVSDELIGNVREVVHHADNYASDHCPISMVYKKSKTPYVPPLAELERQWQQHDWQAAEAWLKYHQMLLALAAFYRDWREVEKLQNRIVRSRDAQMLAVRTISRKNTAAGIDGVRLKTDAMRMQVVLSMNPKNYIPRPYRADDLNDRGKLRTIDIPVARDKAMMLLYKYALDPVAEEIVDRKAFSARKGRGALDLLTYLWRALSADNAPEWVAIFDIKSFYDKSTHKEIIKRTPMDKDILAKFLKAGYIKDGELFAKTQGISLGTSLSPTLGNILLSGLQSYIYDRLYPLGNADYQDGDCFAYADDIIVLTRSHARAAIIYNIVTDFLEERKLTINADKTHISNVCEGFDFLSWHFQQRNGIVQAWPSLAAQQGLHGDLAEIIEKHHGTQRSLIKAINSKLTGWASYYRACDAESAFRQADAVVNTLLLERVEKRYPRWKRKTIRDHYWTTEDDLPVFAWTEDPTVRVIRLASVERVMHEPVSLRYNPYLDPEYFLALKARRAVQKATGNYKEVWRRQQGRCAYCGELLGFGQEFQVVENEIGKGCGVNNLLYIHAHCAFDPFDNHNIYRGMTLNIIESLREMLNPLPEIGSPYFELAQYFHFRDDAIIKLTFDEIEDIIGVPLPFEARLFHSFWYDDTPGYEAPMWAEENYPNPNITPSPRPYCICTAWNSQGYQIKQMNFAEQRIVFQNVTPYMTGFPIPKEVLMYKLPEKIIAREKKHWDKVLRECGF